MIRTNARALIGLRAVAFAVAPQVTTFGRPGIKVSEISRPRAHDRGIEIDHRPIRPRISADYTVGIVAGRATVAHVGPMR